MKRICASLVWALLVCIATHGQAADDPRVDLSVFNQPAPGYQGIWYGCQPTPDEYCYKYSGGLGTYCAKHIPHAVYSKQANKTFFCFGGASPDGENYLVTMVSYYDHATKLVPRPRMLVLKKTDDAHDNPVLSIDDAGYIWVFSSTHGIGRPSYIFRSKQPYSIEPFEIVQVTNFSYPQPWHFPGKGFLFLHTKYNHLNSKGRSLCWMTSRDGYSWEERHLLAKVEYGHYQVSRPFAGKVGTAFNMHPPEGVNFRTNLYYVETDDMGATWRTAAGKPVAPPIKTRDNPALVHDYAAEKKLVYLKDIAFDADGRPVILYVTSASWQPGPEHDPRTWHTAHWNGQAWNIGTITESDNNYDMGSLYTEVDGTWRVIAPTTPGPQAGNPGGEMVLWTSNDQGQTWTRVKQLTSGSEFNHTYARKPLGAHPDFYAFWADGHGRRPSPSRLYFSTKEGEVYRLPYEMKEEMARPERVGQ